MTEPRLIEKIPDVQPQGPSKATQVANKLVYLALFVVSIALGLSLIHI